MIGEYLADKRVKIGNEKMSGVSTSGLISHKGGTTAGSTGHVQLKVQDGVPSHGDVLLGNKPVKAPKYSC